MDFFEKQMNTTLVELQQTDIDGEIPHTKYLCGKFIVSTLWMNLLEYSTLKVNEWTYYFSFLFFSYFLELDYSLLLILPCIRSGLYFNT